MLARAGPAGADDMNTMLFTTLLSQSGKRHSIMSSKLSLGAPNDCSSQGTALGRLSSQAHNSMGYARFFARAVSNPGPTVYNFDDINARLICLLPH